jgi:hypothetical protein
MTIKRLCVINNSLVEAPIWREGKRAKNWAAIIDIEGTAPGGFSRRFLPYGRGPVFYLVERVTLFDALEFAADYVAYSGTPHPERWYGIVVVKTDDFIELEQAADGALAVLTAKAKRTSKVDFLKALSAEKAQLDERAAAIASEMSKIVEGDDKS